MRLILLAFCSFLIAIESSKCPESRKPHSTSCTLFYNCVNLPSGGYVWVPSKCTEGLIFEPYLRMCVLPGDSWTCDTLTESSLITMKYETPELINPNETSYMGSTQDPPNFSEFIDSSYTTDSIPDMLDQEMVTPYPLIEIEETMENMHKVNSNNTMTNSAQYSHLQPQNHTRQEYVLLNQLLHHLLIYKGITIPLELLASLTIPIPLRNHVSISKATTNFSKTSKTNQQSVLMNYLIQNYVQQNNMQNTIITDTKLNDVTETSKMSKKDNADELTLNIIPSNNISQIGFDDSENENSIILITDKSGHKQYLTTDKYKSMGHRVEWQFIRAIPCVKNVRMPNTTDCVKYYVCDPEEASVREYSCPSTTAFNKHTKTCDREAYNKCMKNDQEIANLSNDFDSESQTNRPEKNICTEQGKTKDLNSESHYYICYSSSNKLQGFKSIRLMCPNSLIFCQSKKVCTTRRLCKVT
ncbi:uncharacterized protein LOC143184912 [Calliopsis andreniformis]|uniref:uncharacterized protein LOC143184912 n=1 Tax=Calliopsis andreniformis TaxID=337506 RepID=UPI003FCC3B96